MRIRHELEYDASYTEIASEFCDNDSKYQADALNIIGTQFKIWAADKRKPMTHVQLLEIAEQLNDNGKWFIETLCDYMSGKAESEEEAKTNLINDVMQAENIPYEGTDDR